MASISALAFTAAAGASPSWAADSRYPLDIPAEPLPQQLALLAVATNISIGGVDPARCTGTPTAAQGRFTPAQALVRLLSHTSCTVTVINATTYRLNARPPRAAPPPKASPVLPPPINDTPVEITVLINRRPERVGSAASAISVVSASVIENGDYDIAQLAAYVPGMTVTNLGPGRDKILLRGISDSVLTGRTQSLVGLYIDDTPLTYNAPDPDLMLVDMARVEVMKGPQGALYGQGSMAGVVRMVTNKPQLDAFTGDAEAGVGFTQGEPSYRASGMINLPLLRDRLGVRVVLYDENSGGFIKDPDAGPDATNTTLRAGGRLSGQWRVGQGFVLTGMVLGQQLRSDNSQYVTSMQGPFLRTTPVAEPHDNNLRDVSLDLQGPTTWGTLKIALNRLHHNVFSGYDAQPLAQVINVPNSGQVFYDEQQNLLLETEEVSLVSPSQGKFRWLTGVFNAFSEEHFTPHLVDLFTKRVLYNEDRVDWLHDAALFGELSYDFTPQWTLSGGLRYADDSHVTESQIDHVRLTNYNRFGGVTGNIDTGRASYTVNLRYQPTPYFLWYAQAGDGYRTGGFNTTTLSQTAIPTAYRGDALDSIESGWRLRSPDNRMRLNLAVFHMWWRDIQSDQLRSTGLPITVNLGNGVNTGVELEGDWRVLPPLQFHAVALVNDPRLDEPNALYARDLNSGMPYIAKRSFSLSGTWDRPWHGGTLEDTATVSYRSQSPLDYGPLYDVRMNGYATLDLSSAWIMSKLRYEVRLENASDVKSNSFAYGNPFTLNGSTQVTPLRPRTLWLSIGAGF